MYKKIIDINTINYTDKKVLLVGAGWMAEQYCTALSAMGIRSVTVISRSEQSATRCCREFGYLPMHGGYLDCLPRLSSFDLVIVATPLHELLPAAMVALQCGNRNILIEKPASLYSDELTDWASKVDDNQVRIRVAFNRLSYPNLILLKELVEEEGGITSCRYTFTERIHTIDFSNNEADCYERWGISNSLHVISMAHALIGLPKELTGIHCGGLEWHPAGSRFVGSGVSCNNIPFSYHADWDSAGRWGIEVMTRKNAYRLIPLEELYVCLKGSFTWDKMSFNAAYPAVKQGVAEELALMLDENLEKSIPLTNLSTTVDYLALAERIFNYSSCRS